jgi:restriction system protein
MAVPDFQSFFRPLLDVAADGKEHSMKEAREIIAKRMNIPETDLREMLPSGTQTKFDNRIAWAKSYFVQANVFESAKRGLFRMISTRRSAWLLICRLLIEEIPLESTQDLLWAICVC